MSENKEEEAQPKKSGRPERTSGSLTTRAKLSRKQKTALKAVVLVLLGVVCRPFVEGFVKKVGEGMGTQVAQRFTGESLSTSRQSPVVYRVALINSSSVITDAEAEKVMKSIQTQVHHDLAPVWGVDAELTYTPKGEAPSPGLWWVEIIDEAENKDDEGYLSYHYVGPDGLPRAKVFAKEANKVKGWSHAASQTLMNLLVNPRMRLFTYGSKSEKQPTFYLLEIGSPCRSESYQVEGITVSDFVFPAWYDSARSTESAQFDYLRKISQPFQVLKGGDADVYRVKVEGDEEGVDQEEQQPSGWDTILGDEQQREPEAK